MIPADLTSMKPHLLRAWLGWCAANRLTPLLVTQPLPYVGLPATVLAHAANQQPAQPLVFNLHHQSAANLGFTGKSIFFTTLFPGQRQASTVEIPCQNWRSLRIPELGQRIDLSFPEQLVGEKRADSQAWPQGVGGIIQARKAPPPTQHNTKEGQAEENQSQSQPAGKPSLVWINSKKP